MTFYDNLKNYVSQDNVSNDKIKELEKDVDNLRNNFIDVNSKVEGLNSKVDTVELKAVNAEISSISSSSIKNTGGSIKTDTLNAAKDVHSPLVRTTKIDANNGLVREDLEVKGNLTVGNKLITTQFTDVELGKVTSKDLYSDFVDAKVNIKLVPFKSGPAVFQVGKTYMTHDKLFNMSSDSAEFKTTNFSAKNTTLEDLNVSGATTLDNVNVKEISDENLHYGNGKIDIKDIEVSDTADINLLKASKISGRGGDFIEINNNGNTFVGIKPFNGTYLLKFVSNNGDNLFSVKLNSVCSSTLERYTKVIWAMDNRECIKEIQLFEDGIIYLKVGSLGKLYYSCVSVDETVAAPITVYQYKPVGAFRERIVVDTLRGECSLGKLIKPTPIESINETGNLPIGIILAIDENYAGDINELGGTWKECNENGELL